MSKTELLPCDSNYTNTKYVKMHYKGLIVHGRHNTEYMCTFSKYAISFSQIHIHRKKSFFGIFSYWWCTYNYTEGCTYLSDLDRGLPDYCLRRYKTAVKFYEEQKYAWSIEGTKI